MMKPSRAMTKTVPVNRQHLATVDSTNTWAKKNAHTFDRDAITLVTADQQTAGRGRFKRSWISPPNVNIYASFCFFLPDLRPDVGNLAQVLALSASDVLESHGLQPRIHWPNDILVNEKKIAGILCETTPVEKKICVVIGIGININMPQEDLAKVDRPATSLSHETGKNFKIDDILKELQDQFSLDLPVFIKDGFPPFFKRFVQLMTMKKGKNLRINDFQQVYEGAFHSINPNGSVNVLLPLNEIRTFLAGEIL